jgi:hypothetical protein
VWVPTASSLCALHVRPTLPKPRSERCLSARGKPSGTLDWGPESLPWADERDGKGRQVVKSCLPTLNSRVENRRRGWSSGLILFRLVAPPLHPRVVGPFPGTGCMVPQPFAAGGNRLCPRFFWAVTGGPRYPGKLPR